VVTGTVVVVVSTVLVGVGSTIVVLGAASAEGSSEVVVLAASNPVVGEDTCTSPHAVKVSSATPRSAMGRALITSRLMNGYSPAGYGATARYERHTETLHT
jgi:hypothetical protein